MLWQCEPLTTNESGNADIAPQRQTFHLRELFLDGLKRQELAAREQLLK